MSSQVMDIISNAKQVFKHTIDKSHWMDKGTKGTALKKVG